MNPKLGVWIGNSELGVKDRRWVGRIGWFYQRASTGTTGRVDSLCDISICDLLLTWFHQCSSTTTLSSVNGFLDQIAVDVSTKVSWQCTSSSWCHWWPYQAARSQNDYCHQVVLHSCFLIICNLFGNTAAFKSISMIPISFPIFDFLTHAPPPTDMNNIGACSWLFTVCDRLAKACKNTFWLI